MTREQEWQALNLREVEAKATAKFLTTAKQRWESYPAKNGFYKVRPIQQPDVIRADSIANFVEGLSL